MASTSRSVLSDAIHGRRTRDKRSKIVIPLPLKPPDYVPGSGPALQPLALLPQHDSTAYIVERILLPSPGLANNGRPLPKRMTYIVGWHDMPAARMLVPAMQILDYVSPRALEEWEWQLEMDLDEERARLEEEEKDKRTEEETAPKKKRGRPPAHSQIEAAATAAPEPDATPHTRPRKGAMSLSTPQKAAMDVFEGLSEGLSEEGESPTRQLRHELAQSSGGLYMQDVKMSDWQDNSGERDSSASGLEEFTDMSLLKASRGRGRASRPTQMPFKSDFDSSTEQSSDRTSFTAFSTLPRRNPADSGNRQFVTSQALPVSNTKLSFQRGILVSPLAADHRTAPSIFQAEGSQTLVSEAGIGAQSPDKAKKVGRPTTKGEESVPILKHQSQEENQEVGWEVKHIEDVEVYEVEGQELVRYFKVRWEGDWPPDQNPSWEPEGNLPAGLIRNYFKQSKKAREKLKRKAKIQKKKKPPTRQTRPSLSQVQSYNSVSVAFTGDMDLNGAGEDEMDLLEVSNDADEADEEELFLVDVGLRPMDLGRMSWNGNSDTF